MRDPKRIRPLVERIVAVWEANPDMRLGQIMHHVNARQASFAEIQFVEDEQLVQAIERMLPSKNARHE